MPKLLRSLSIAVVLAPFIFSLSFAANNSEEITITTYYPSPYGSYNELQLYPHSPAAAVCGPDTKGTMYYDATLNSVLVCNGAGPNDWGSVGGYWTLTNDNRLQSASVSGVEIYGALWVRDNSVTNNLPTSIYLVPKNDSGGRIQFLGSQNGIGANIGARPDDPSAPDLLGLGFTTSIDRNSATERMRINTKGNVVIGGPADDTYRLKVYGSVQAEDLVVKNGGSITLNGVSKTDWPSGGVTPGDLTLALFTYMPKNFNVHLNSITLEGAEQCGLAIVESSISCPNGFSRTGCGAQAYGKPPMSAYAGVLLRNGPYAPNGCGASASAWPGYQICVKAAVDCYGLMYAYTDSSGIHLGGW